VGTDGQGVAGKPLAPQPVRFERARYISPKIFSCHVSQLFYQHQKFQRFDCGWLKKKLQRRNAVNTPRTRFLCPFSSGWVSSLKINSTSRKVVFFLLSNAQVGSVYYPHLLEKRGPTTKRRHSSRSGAFSCAKLRSGANYKRYTCLERSTLIPPTQDPHQG